MQTVRNFAHKRFGDIGRVVLESDVKVIKLNGKPLPEQSVEYLLNFALQSLQDAYAGAESADEAKANFAKRFERLIEGKIGVREGGTSVPEATRVARSIVRAKLKAKLEKAEYEAKYKDDDAAVDAVFEKNKEKLQPFVDARLEELRKERERKAKMAKAVDELDI
jgi:hypothetical protein